MSYSAAFARTKPTYARAEATLRRARRYGGLCQELAAGMIKERRTYLPRIIGDKVMMPAD